MGLLEALVQQSKRPTGFLGNTMLKIMNSAHNKLMGWGLSKAAVQDTSTVLDIGCGGGKTIQMLSPLIGHGRIYGIDYSEEAVLTSSKANAEDIKSGKVSIKQASVSAIPFSDEFFDVITAFQTHYFWPNLKGDMAEVYRVLKPEGRFVLVSELYKMEYHMNEYKTPDALEELLTGIGFLNITLSQTSQAICLVAWK